MKVILRETVESLGAAGDEVSVADGYARNYLLPRKKAVLATPGNRKLLENQKARLQLKAMRGLTKAEVLAKEIQGTVCTITAKVVDGDRLYGSVTARDIVEQLKAKGFEIDKRAVMLSEPIKNLGAYIVPLQLHPDVKSEITVKVIAEEAPARRSEAPSQRED
ncbi:MAG: 50S ribosomal protein L9 [Deltaproteobacteria bacterium]|nr:50S ribosomal protein L9 [Deltaproteobacteria bacterium]